MHLPNNTLLQGGKYKIIRFISSGGFGCTYEAEHVMLGKRIAIKEFFVKDFCNRDEATSHVTVGTQSKKPLIDKLKKKFIEEAVAISRFSHPNIVKVTDVFEENSTAYYVMDFIDGMSVLDILKMQTTFPEETAIKYITQVAEALKVVHAQNRLHLDVKPGNIMIDQNDNAILIDFGSSKQYDEVDGENTSTMIGYTQGYAPLEQMGNNVVSFMPATDIYSLGATLYKMLSGKTPKSAILIASGEEPEQLLIAFSLNIQNVVERSMSINKRNRPQSIDEFLKLLTESSSVCNPIPPITLNQTVDNVVVPSTTMPDKDQPRDIEENNINDQSDEDDKEDTIIENPQSYSKDEVDLGLSVLWRRMNFGAQNQLEIGELHGWGNMPVQNSFIVSSTWSALPECISGTEFDIITETLGCGWRMPTYLEIKELIDKCEWRFLENKFVAGYDIKGPNGNSIFLPATGKGWHDLRLQNSCGYYWTGDKGKYMTSWYLYFSRDTYDMMYENFSILRAIRPVKDKNGPV